MVSQCMENMKLQNFVMELLITHLYAAWKKLDEIIVSSV